MWDLMPLATAYYVQGINFIFCWISVITPVYCSALVSGNIRTLQKAACETQELVIKCPMETLIYIQFANYGRLVSSRERPCHIVAPTGSLPNVSIFHSPYDIEEESRNCIASQSKERVVSLCQDKRTCKIPVNAEIFKQDPCPRTWKYLEVAYKCIPNVFQTNVVCEGDEMTLECESPAHRLAVHTAMFGRDRSGGNAVCHHQNSRTPSRLPPETQTECASSFATEIVMQKCQNERICTIQADESTFGNQCPINTRKYLTVSYACVPQRILISPPTKNKNVDGRMPVMTGSVVEEKAEDYLTLEMDEDNALTVGAPAQSVDMQAIQPDHPAGAARKNKLDQFGPSKKALGTGADGYGHEGQCNCTESFSVLMDWIVAYQKIKQNKEKCILYACLSAGIGLLLIMLFLLVHLLIKRKQQKNKSKTVMSQSSAAARALSAKTREQRIPLYNTHYTEEDETDTVPVDLTSTRRYNIVPPIARNTLPRAASNSFQVEPRKATESRSMHRLTTDGSFYS
ncbi:protein eva-1-like [Paramacrobiotus metropolitanus]|uniref:protein eva-1-like n=1 Tax=Paramacrobiotus metropolitanus TaxID=2943436 RepID=UPI002445EEC8|nr:protein eva-1-like [Paramacrobiotus metropolitanus]